MDRRRFRHLLRAAVVVLAIGGTLLGCGAKGDLYLPDETQPSQQP